MVNEFLLLTCRWLKEKKQQKQLFERCLNVSLLQIQTQMINLKKPPESSGAFLRFTHPDATH